MPLESPIRSAWLLGLAPLALIWGATSFLAAPGIAARIAAEGQAVAQGTVAEGGEPWLRVHAAGRDLIAEGEAPGPAEREAALQRLAALTGPRRVVAEVGLVEAAAPFVWTATRTAEGLALAGSRPVEIGRQAFQTRIAGVLPAGAALSDEAHAARGAPPDFAEAALWSAARLSGLGRGARAEIADTAISFSGAAVDVAAYDALRTAFADLPRGYTLGRVDILPPAVGDFRFQIERVAGGGLVLSGFTVSEAVRGEIRRLAAEAADGAFVDDRTQTARGLPQGLEARPLAEAMLRLLGLMQTGRVTFENGRVSAEGDALDGQAVGEAEALLRAGLPAGVSAGRLALAARPLSPYRVTIRREGESVVLSGHLPDAEARERLLRLVRAGFFRERVVDRTRLAEGAPADLAGALAAAVPALATLAAGEIRVADRSLGLTGESLYPESAARLGLALPPGWAGRVSVQARDAAPRQDAGACTQGFAAAARDERVRFAPGSIALTPAVYPALDDLAALARACPALRFAVAGHADPPGAKPEEPAPGEGTLAEAGAEEPKAGVKPTKPPKGKAAKPGEKAADKPAPKPEETADLARLRAQAVAEYLLQAGARPEQVGVSEEPAGERRAVGFLPRS